MKHRIVHTLQKYVLNPPISSVCGGAAAARICVARNEKTKDREATGAENWLEQRHSTSVAR